MEVQKKSGISYEEFIEDHYKPRVPVILVDISANWKVRGLVTPDYLKKNFPERTTFIDHKKYSLGDLVDLVVKSTPEKPAPYPAIFEIRTELPELLPLISPVDMGYAKPNWFQSKPFVPGKLGNSLELFIGGPGSQFPFAHIDQYYTNAWITQIYGEKHITVFPSGQDEYLYPEPGNEYVSTVNVFNPDLNKHPLFKNATPIKSTIKEGETLFIPRGTWHTASSAEVNISIIFDQINNVNFSEWKNDLWNFKKRHSVKNAVMSYAFASLAGGYFKIRESLGIK